MSDEDIRIGINADASTWLRIAVEDEAAPWATDTAREVWAQTTREPAADELATVVAQLTRTHQDARELNLPEVYAFYPNLAHAPHPLAALAIWEPTDGSQEMLAAAAGAEDTDNAEPASQLWVETPLGVALKVARLLPTIADPRQLARLVTYVWDLPTLGATLALTTGSSLLDRMAACADALDDLARGVYITGLS